MHSAANTVVCFHSVRKLGATLPLPLEIYTLQRHQTNGLCGRWMLSHWLFYNALWALKVRYNEILTHVRSFTQWLAALVTVGGVTSWTEAGWVACLTQGHLNTLG